jgi:hypothetical protein
MKAWRVKSIFTPSEVSAAFAALQTHAAALYSAEASGPLTRFTHRRRGEGGYRRDHIELPLQHLHDKTEAFHQLPGEVRHICVGLHEAAREYLEAGVREPSALPAARAEIQDHLGKKSVLRVLRYPAGSGCRPHVDPGLCTALLTGSVGGLEVNTTDEIPVSFMNRPGDYRSRFDVESDGGEGQRCHKPAESDNVLDLLPHWEAVVTTHPGEAVVMASSMMGVISGGTLPGVLHRVRRDWSDDATGKPLPFFAPSPHRSSAQVVGTPGYSTDNRVSAPTSASTDQHDGANNAGLYRFNIVVELRPAQARRWYAAAATDVPAAKSR